jgi:hypothetical protein
MGIALLTFSDFFADVLTPLQSLADRWLPTRRASHIQHDAGLRYVAVRPSCNARGTASDSSIPPIASARPLRVVRVVDPYATGHGVGRVVISGRMVDVCAELDRLAALESLDNPVSSAQIH